ncbi:DMT family transporter [Thermodesulfobacteriota bacterium]
MVGAFFAFLTALAWAGSSTFMKLIVAKIDILSLNSIRLWVGSAILLIFIPLTGRIDQLIQTPFAPFLYVLASGFIAMVMGDSLYIKALSLLDASIVFPLAQGSFPLFSVLVAVFFLGESFTWINAVGAVLVVSGIYPIAVAGKRSETSTKEKSFEGKGVIFALGASIAWTCAVVTLKIGVLEMDPFVAAGIRIPASAIVITLLALSRLKQGTLRLREYGVKGIGFAGAAGILTYGVAAVGYVKAFQLIGAAKTVLLTTTAPVFLLIFSVFILKERPTRSTIAGIFVCVVGICFVLHKN